MAEILEFTGTLSPDSVGYFVEEGTYNGEKCYHNTTKGFWHWYWPDETAWMVSLTKGVYLSGFWNSVDKISAIYEPMYGYTGWGDMHGPLAHHHIYCGQDGNVDYENIQAEMLLDADSIAIPNQVLPPGTIWHYIRRQVSKCGKESKDSPLCKVVIDAEGNMVPLCPNPPMDLAITPIAGGKFKIRWRYNTADQEIPPTGFKIYLIEDGEWTLLDTVTYLVGGYGEFTWTSSEFEDGQKCQFGVRSYAEGFGESQNTNIISATADAVGPPVITGLEAVVEEI